jgi:undecaprenyl diphosphate synthase
MVEHGLEIPNHVAIIMDGNGRWANHRKLKRTVGHQVGISAVKEAIATCLRRGISHLSLFAFGQDNWQRSNEETSFLMQLFYRSLKSEYRKLHARGINVRFIGDTTVFTGELAGMIDEAQSLTCDNEKLILTIAVNYSGQWDIVNAIAQFSELHGRSPLSSDELAKCLTTTALPNPDLFIRTSGEQRISNYMLWQLAYTELYFTQTYWPDFNAHCFEKALLWYGKRSRRFGCVDEMI